jgi:hypothetical protein
MPFAMLFALLTLAQDPAPEPVLALLDHAHLATELAGLANAHPDLVQRFKLGDSRAGRAIEGLRFAGKGAAEDKARPAILLVANLDGPRVYSSAVALQHARALAEGYASDAKVQALLDTTTVYVVPRANPDAAEARFASPRFEQHASGTGVDDDRDGRAGEDPPADVDGDGVIGWLRVKDGDGEWREDPTDPRALVKAERVKGERGVYVLWPEGRDSDKDERVAEDAPLDARVDRNFPAGWEQHTAAAGLFPTDEPETRALCDFVLAHPDLALVVVYDAQDTLVGEVKSVGDEAPNVKRIPPEGVLESDAKMLGELGKRYKNATAAEAKAEGGDKGTFPRWCYEHRGLFVLATTLWDIPLEEKKDGGKKDEAKKEGEAPKEGGEGKPADEKPSEQKKDEPKAEKAGGDKAKKDDEPKPSDDAKRLKWIDAAGASEAWRFLPWKPFQHPDLGAVEIGGLAPFARLEPPASESGVLAKHHFEWFLTLGELAPHVRIAECTRERLGENLVRVTAVVENDSYLPLQSRSARRTATIRPAKVKLVLPEAGKRLGGPVQEFVDDLAGSGGRKEFQWLVQGPDAMEIAVSIETQNAGTAIQKAEVKKP